VTRTARQKELRGRAFRRAMEYSRWWERALDTRQFGEAAADLRFRRWRRDWLLAWKLVGRLAWAGVPQG
jgi:hypothetical protein